MSASMTTDTSGLAPPTAARRFAKKLATVMDDVRPTERGAVVLAYHRVGALTPSPVDMATKMFRRQMAHLRACGQIATLDSVVDGLLNPAAHDASAVAVTFDDGTADFVDIALPILIEFDIPTTLYLATSFVDSGVHYPAHGRPVSWSALRDAVSTGLVSIGAHTHNHVLLDRCSIERAANELETCSARIEDEVGITPRHFAYPKAVAARPEVERLVRSRYRSAAVAGTRPNCPGSVDVHRLHRSPIQNADGWDGFVRKILGGMRTEDDLRRLVNVVRYRGKTS
jgi:peptidoglycan/xylan/chitin deacetylase (PgdA/CDA1 family)